MEKLVSKLLGMLKSYGSAPLGLSSMLRLHFHPKIVQRPTTVYTQKLIALVLKVKQHRSQIKYGNWTTHLGM